MLLFINFFKKKTTNENEIKNTAPKKNNNNKVTATRKGELGEYKIDIQLSQLPKEYKSLSDLLIKNEKAKSGHSQIDHVIITPYGIFVIETKNYQGTIYAGVDRKTWSVNGKFKMMNPFIQNYGHIEALKYLINEKYHSYFISMVSFTKRATFKLETLEYRKIQSNELIVYDVELSEYIHRKISILKIQFKAPVLTETEINSIYHSFVKANITDENIRKNHVEALKNTLNEKKSFNKSVCTVCQIPVSEKVKDYCLSNSKFKGEIYCYEHQKSISFK